jgi:ankyrin repeat protein
VGDGTRGRRSVGVRDRDTKMLGRHRVGRLGSVVVLCGGLAASTSAAVVDPPLIAAVKRQDAEAVQRLLDDGFDVDARQPDGATALHWAVYREDLETVEVLLRAGASVDAVNRMGAAPLWLASANGDAAAIARLLDAGANPNVALWEGESPLMTAARSGTGEGVRLLLEAGADPNARETSRDQTALMWAVTQGQHQVVQVLLDAGADVEARSKVRPRLMYDVGPNAGVFDQGVIVNLGGFTALLFAARHGDVASARLLLAAGAAVDNPAANGASPLVVATHSGHTAFSLLLLAEGAVPDAIGAGYTALHAAVLRGDLTTVEALLDRGADPNIRLAQGTPIRRTSEDWTLSSRYVSATPFWLAASFREPAIMRLLAAAGANPTLTITEVWRGVVERAGGVGPPRVVGGFVTPLMAAVRGSSDRGRFFLVNPDPVVEEQRTLEAVAVAVDLGADLEATDYSGTAALHDAASRNLPSVVRLLANRGADLDVENGRGRTPIQLAVAASRRPRVVTFGTEWTGETAVDVLRELGAKEPAQ